MRVGIGLTVLATMVTIGAYTGCVLSQKKGGPEAGGDQSGTRKEAGFLNQIHWPPEMADEETMTRYLASDDPSAKRGEAYLVYYTNHFPGKPRRGKDDEDIEAFGPRRWAQFPAGPRARRQKLIEFWYANTRDVSHDKKGHVACYHGSVKQVIDSFFKNQEFADIADFQISPSADGFMMGVQFLTRSDRTGKVSQVHFRLPSCQSVGKTTFFSDNLLQAGLAKARQFEAGEGREPNSLKEAPALFGKEALEAFEKQADRAPAAVAEDEGFKMTDTVSGDGGRLPRFDFEGNYESAAQFLEEDLPWLKADFDLGTEEGQMEFALLMQEYVYDGMFNQSPKPDENFIPQKNRKRYWCHMPWLNQGPAAREAIHGLTMERNLEPSVMYPKSTAGSDWGVAVYNGPGCLTIGEVFGSEKRPNGKPDFSRARFRDGAVSAKVLFTTAEFPAVEGAFAWAANVSLPNATVRSLHTVRHIQMDIGIKDSRIKVPGGHHGDGWIMLTYYYDKSYRSPLDKRIKGLPEGLLRMRPSGSAWGFTAKESHILKGALTNVLKERGPLLNGPADNPKSSCMGCHGVAGTGIRMTPGIESKDQWDKVKGKAMDFSQQFSLAKRNYETRLRPPKN